MFNEFLSELQWGSHYAVFIDDTGSPGCANSTPHLPPDRKTWVAVIVSPDQICHILTEFPNAISELRRATGATEFHFKDIFQGTRQFKGVAPNARIALFEFMAELFSIYKFPVLVQSLDSTDLSKLHSKGLLNRKLGQFDFNQRADVALLLLLHRVKEYLEKERTNLGVRARVFIDEGFKKTGTALKVPGFESVFLDSTVNFASSTAVLPLQLADFAAFSLNRVQMTVGKEILNDGEMKLLEILQKMQLNYINIEKRELIYMESDPKIRLN